MSRVLLVAAAVSLLGCATGTLEEVPGTDRRDPTDPDAPTVVDDPSGLRLDTSPTEPYGRVETPAMSVVGSVESSAGVDRVEVGGVEAPTGPGGGFTHPVEPPVGLSLAEVRAWDVEGNVAQGHRSMLRADYLPEGQLDPDAARLTVTPELLLGLAGGDVSGLDVSSLVPPGTEFATGPCALTVDSVRHSSPELALSMNDAGQIVASVTVRDVAVGFHGECSVDIPVLGGLRASALPGSELDETTVVVTVVLEPNEVAPGSCLDGFRAAATSVSIPSLDLDLRVTASGIPAEVCLPPFGVPCVSTDRLLGEAVGELAEGYVADLLEDQLTDAVGGAVDDLLSDFGGLEEETMLDFFDTPITVGICLTGLEPMDGQLVATVGARASSGAIGGRAPGAPFLETIPMGSAPGTLYLDPNLVGQLLFSAYQGGALEMEDLTADSSTPITAGLLSIFAPGLTDLPGVDASTPLKVDLSAELAPIAWAPETGAADLALGLGQLRLTLGTPDGALIVVGAHVELGLALEPATGGIAPVVLADESVAEVWVESAAVPLTERQMEGLEEAVRSVLLEQLPGMLEGTVIELPDIGVPLTPGDVRRTEGGFLEMPLL